MSKAQQLRRWESLLTDIANPATELTVEVAAPLVATFSALLRMGHKFDAAVIVLMNKLREQLSDGKREGCIEDWDDQDDDISDSFTEN